MTALDADLVEAKVNTMPDCDFAEYDDDECKGEDRFDFKTQMGPWANGCNLHYERYRLYMDLGTGKGQRLVLNR